MRDEVLSEARGSIVHQFVEIETTLNWTLGAVLFHGSAPLWFSMDLLANEHCSFALRLSLLDRTLTNFEGREILDRKSRDFLLDRIRKMASIRNVFAHAGDRWGSGPSGGLYFHPKKSTLEPLDWSSLGETFRQLRSEVLPALDRLAQKVSNLYEAD